MPKGSGYRLLPHSNVKGSIGLRVRLLTHVGVLSFVVFRNNELSVLAPKGTGEALFMVSVIRNSDCDKLISCALIHCSYFSYRCRLIAVGSGVVLTQSQGLGELPCLIARLPSFFQIVAQDNLVAHPGFQEDCCIFVYSFVLRITQTVITRSGLTSRYQTHLFI